MDRDVNGMSLPELRSELAEIRGKAGKAIEQMGANLDPSLITVLEGDAAGKMAALAGMNARASALGAAIDAKSGIERAQRAYAAAGVLESPFTPEGDEERKERQGEREFKTMGQR